MRGIVVARWRRRAPARAINAQLATADRGSRLDRPDQRCRVRPHPGVRVAEYGSPTNTLIRPVMERCRILWATRGNFTARGAASFGVFGGEGVEGMRGLGGGVQAGDLAEACDDVVKNAADPDRRVG